MYNDIIEGHIFYFRMCPQCNKKLKYSGTCAKYNCRNSESNCIVCVDCAIKNKMTPELRYKFGSANRGKKQSKETIEKRSKSLTGKKRKPFTKQHLKNLSASHRGHHPSEETREKLRQSSRKAWKDGKFDKMVQQTVSKSETLFLNTIEKEFNIKFDNRQFELEGRYFDAKLGNCLIEVDSKWWHTLTEHKENDLLKEFIASKNGYKIYRFEVNSEKEVFGKIEDCSNRIKEFIGLACT